MRYSSSIINPYLNHLVRPSLQMELVDEFKHPKTNRTSLCYTITFRAMDRTLTDAEVNEHERQIREKVRTQLNVELR